MKLLNEINPCLTITNSYPVFFCKLVVHDCITNILCGTHMYQQNICGMHYVPLRENDKKDKIDKKGQLKRLKKDKKLKKAT